MYKLKLTSALVGVGLAVGSSAPASAQIQAPQPPAPTMRNAQIHLSHLGFHLGAADGKAGPLTNRAACMFARLTGHRAELAAPRKGLRRVILHTHRLPKPAHGPATYLSISLKCQMIAKVKNRRYAYIVPASTGRAGTDSLGRPSFATRPGRWRIMSRVDGIQESNAYSGGLMYRPMYFSGGEAIHGEPDNQGVAPYFASHGCVRTFREDQDMLWRDSSVGEPVYVS